jgi:putative spermidine/putrescine transport system ATP-binding protein
MAAEPQPRLRLERLCKRFGEVVAVDAIDLTVAAGEFLTLLGPSGSGKTTTLMMIAGFEEPTSGELWLDGRPMIGVPSYRRNYGMVFQNYALFPHKSVADNIAFPLRMRGMARERRAEQIKRALDLVRLPDHGDRYPNQLSGGQQQRVALARALVYNPPVLLMDEPLGALDKKLREEMQLEIKHIQKELGITTIYVTHDQEEALVMSDRIAVINEGRIEQLADPGTLYARPRTRFVADFIGESNILPLDQLPAHAAGGVAGAWLVVRPEAVRFAGPSPLDCVLDGTVEEMIYVGDTTRYKVRIADDLIVTAKLQNRSGEVRATPGERCSLGWQRDDAIVVDA